VNRRIFCHRGTKTQRRWDWSFYIHVCFHKEGGCLESNSRKSEIGKHTISVKPALLQFLCVSVPLWQSIFTNIFWKGGKFLGGMVFFTT
ncbi:MAG TPA: hypothetical protein PLX69_19335, partial [Leptospiraceae bacterium]|nr:hypothetical protein [Leptospiraceae bacterium]